MPKAPKLGDADKAEGEDLWAGIQAAWQYRGRGQNGGFAISPFGMNDRGSPAEAKVLAEIVVHDYRSLAVIGHLSSAAAISAVEVYAKSAIPVVLPTASSPDLKRSRLSELLGGRTPMTFRLIPDDLTCQAPVLADIAWTESNGKLSIAIVQDTDEDTRKYSKPLADGVYSCLSSALAKSQVGVSTWDVSAMSDQLPKQLRSIAASSAEIVVFIGYSSAFQRVADVLESVYQGESRPVFILSDGCMEPDLELPMFRVLVACPVALPSSGDLVGVNANQHAQLVAALGERNLVDFMLGFDAMTVILSAGQYAFDRRGVITHSTLTESLESDTFKGWATSYEFDEGENSHAPYYVYEFQPGSSMSFATRPVRQYSASEIRDLRFEPKRDGESK